MIIRLRIPKDDNALSNFIVGYFAVQAINLFVRFVIGDIIIWESLSGVLLAVLLLFALPTMLHRKAAIFIGCEFGLIIIYLLSFLGGNANSKDLFSVAFNAITIFLPMGICALCIEDRRQFFEKLYKISFFGQFLIIFTMYYTISSQDRNYSISCSYALLLFLLVVFGKWFEKHKWYNLIMSVVDLLAIVFFGSRGAIVCVVAFVIILCAINPNIKLQRKLLYLLIIAALSLLVIFYFREIVIFLSNRLSAAGFSSRTLRLALQDELLLHDSGRKTLYEFYIAQVQKHPILGWGILGGRIELYPHNIYIELMLSFGIAIGTLVFVCLIIILIRGVLQKDRTNQLVAAIFIANEISLLFSGSVFTNAEFFVCLALCLAQSKRIYGIQSFRKKALTQEA